MLARKHLFFSVRLHLTILRRYHSTRWYPSLLQGSRLDLSLHLSRSYPFSTTTLCPDLILLLQRSCLAPCLHISLDLATHSTFIGGQNTPTIKSNINIHVARKANKASIAKILGNPEYTPPQSVLGN